MGKAAGGGGGGAETKKKKKGRPSLLDVQKRLLKQQKLQQSPAETPNSQSHSDTHSNPSRRSNRRYPNSDWSHQASELISGDDDDDERIQKKRRPLLGLDSQSPNLFASDNYEGEKVSKVTDTGDVNGSQEVSGPTTPLPDKKLLAFILDRLQKKDTHGVFSEPVDPEELPDYHDIIKHPMDFGTVRKKLDEGAYANLEQFEKDIFLICSNAMQYNAPDTIFFKQARSMEEIAKKDFENLRQESDDSELEQPKETPKVVRRGRPPGSGKGSKKFTEANKSAAYGIGTEASSDTVGNNSFLSSSYNLRRAPDPCIFQSADSPVNAFRGTPNRENQNTWFAEFDREFPASVLRRVMKEGKKLFTSEDNRRESYRQNLFGQEQSVFPPEMAAKQLALVDFQSEHAYARSVAQFAADLGPVAQRIASKKIASALQCGMDLGLRLIAENGTSDRNQQLQGQNVVAAPSPSNNASVADVAGSHHVGSSGYPAKHEEDSELARRLTSQSKLTSPSTSLGDVPFLQSQQNPIGGTRYNDCSGPSEVTRGVASNGSNSAHRMLVNSIDLERQNFFDSSGEFQQRSTVKHEFPEERCLDLRVGAVEQNPQRGSVSCEPNGRFLVAGSSQQPDLGLQL